MIIFIYSFAYFVSSGHRAFFKLSLVFFCSVTLFCAVNIAINRAYSVEKVSAVPSLVIWDLAGIYTNKGIKPELPKLFHRSKNKSVFWLDAYDHRVCSLCWLSEASCIGDVDKSGDYVKLWVSQVKKYPKEYLKHRINFSLSLLGFPLQYPYKNYNQNEGLGKKFQISISGKYILDKYFASVKTLSAIGIYQPLLYVLVCLLMVGVSFLKLFRQAKLNLHTYFKSEVLILCFSITGFMNAVSLMFLSVAADYRYMIWSVFSGILSIVLMIVKKIKPS